MTEVPQDHVEIAPGRFSILVVDDERLIANSLSAILRARGFCVRTAYGAEVALEVVEKFHPDLLISDVWMPEMSGVQLGLTMVKIVPACKVLLFSGHATEADLIHARESGHSFPLLTKPVHPSEMLWHVGEILGITVGEQRPAAWGRGPGAGSGRESLGQVQSIEITN